MHKTRYLWAMLVCMPLSAATTIFFCYPSHSEEKSAAANVVKNATDTADNTREPFSPPFRRGPWRQGEREPMPMGGGRSMQPPSREWIFSRERMENLRAENPELADLIEKSFRLDLEIQHAAEYCRNAAQPVERDKIKGSLRKLLEQQFELEGRRQRMEIEMLEKRISRLKDALKSREENKSQLLDKRLQRVLQPPSEEEKNNPVFEDRFRGGPGAPEGRGGGWGGGRNRDTREKEQEKPQEPK